jgi:hypothetical protein
LVLLGVLEIGRDLAAPVAVGGTWDVAADLRTLSSAPCAAPAAADRQTVLEITQSGKYLAVALDGMRGLGRLEDAALTAAELRPAGGGACGSGAAPVYLHAAIEGSPDHDRMAGTIGIKDCSACAAVPFRATRRRPAKVAP